MSELIMFGQGIVVGLLLGLGLAFMILLIGLSREKETKEKLEEMKNNIKQFMRKTKK